MHNFAKHSYASLNLFRTSALGFKDCLSLERLKLHFVTGLVYKVVAVSNAICYATLNVQFIPPIEQFCFFVFAQTSGRPFSERKMKTFDKVLHMT